MIAHRTPPGPAPRPRQEASPVLPEGVRLLTLPKISDPRGNLTFVEEERHVPFRLARVYWIYDVPGGETRGGHAYHELDELVIAVSGSFDVVLSDGKTESVISLNRSYHGVFVPRRTWRQLENFSSNAVALILASVPYCETDYIRDYDEFLALAPAG